MDIAHSLSTEGGQLTCAAQDDVLHACDQLYVAQKITDNQLLYLRHLILIRDDAIAEAYDLYLREPDGAVEGGREGVERVRANELAKALYELANRPRDEADDDDGDDDGDDEDDGNNDEEFGISGYAEAEQGDGDDDGDEEERPSQFRKANGEPITLEDTHAVSGVVVSMIHRGLLPGADAELLIELIQGQDAYVMAAFELYMDDRDESELVDTLLR